MIGRPGARAGARAVPFEVEESKDAPGRRTLRLHGELDIASAAALNGRFAEALSEGDDGITLDLGELEFIDSTGINAVLLMREVCAERRCELEIVHPSRKVFNVFELVGLADMISGPGDEPPSAGPA